MQSAFKQKEAKLLGNSRASDTGLKLVIGEAVHQVVLISEPLCGLNSFYCLGLFVISVILLCFK